MYRKLLTLVVGGFFVVNVCGCLLLGAAAGGAGTALWLSGKLQQEVNAPVERVVSASKSALGDLKLTVVKETIKEDVAQIISNYTDGKTVWIDLHRISPTVTRIEVRVGATGDKAAARKILNAIVRYL